MAKLALTAWRVTLSDSFGKMIVPQGAKKIATRHVFVASSRSPETNAMKTPQEAKADFMQDPPSSDTIKKPGQCDARDPARHACDMAVICDSSRRGQLADRIAAEIPGIRRYARRLERNPDEAEDLVQDAIERALRKSHGWRGGSLAGWLRRIVFTVFANRRSRTLCTQADIPVDGALETASPPDQEDRLACRDIARAIDTLPAEQRIAVSLAIRPECSYKENAQAAGMPVGTFRSRLSRAREKLRDRLTAPHTQAAQWRVG